MIDLQLGDARELSKSIPDNSIDLIFTDPPYPKEYLSLYEWLGQEAKRVLKPNGFLLVYTGGFHKDAVMDYMRNHLAYFWDYIIMHPGGNTVIWPRLTQSRYKSILAYTKDKGMPRHRVLSAYTSLQDKSHHIWGQDVGPARYYIDCFSRPGDLVWEPFVGGGTTLVVCKQLHRNCIGFEIDPVAYETTKKRLEIIQPLLLPERETQLELIN
jgi:DNA modification methylase